jgi:hypothetical protein
MNGTHVSVGWLLVLVTAVMVVGGGTATAGEPPLADAGLDQQVQQNATVLLDAAGSRDPDGTIESYRWTVETPSGLTVRPANASAARTSFVARQPGRYEVTVTVWDDDGYTASDTLYVDVAPVAASQRPDGPGDAAPPSEPSPETPPSEDTTASEWTAAERNPPDDARPTCSDGGRYLPAFDSCEAVGDYPPTISISGPTVVSPGSEHSFVAEASDFPDGIDRIEWAGGETGSMVLREFSAGTDKRTLRATVYDGEGNTRTARHTVYVGAKDLPPEVDVDGPESGCVGEQVSFEGTASARPGDQIERSWWPGPGPVFTPGEPGVYSRTFKASDDDGQTATDTEQVRVGECTGPMDSRVPSNREITDQIVIMGTDTSLQATVETTALTRGSYGEDAERMAGGGAAGVLADTAEGIRHLVRNSGETVAGQDEKVLTRVEMNESAAKRAVLTAQGEYGRVETNPDESPEQVLFEDDRALVNPTIVDGMDRDADNYVVVVKQGSRQNIADRVQNGRQGIESAEPFESSGNGGVSAATSHESGSRPNELLDPIADVGERAADRTQDAYYETLTFRDRLLDDGNTPADMARITGDRLVGENISESVGEALNGRSTETDSGTDQPTSDPDPDPAPETGDSSDTDSTTRQSAHTSSGGDGSDDEILPSSVSETVQDLNPLSGGDDSGSKSSDDDDGATHDTSSSNSSGDDEQDSGSDSFSLSLPDSVGSDTSSDSGSSSSDGSSSSSGSDSDEVTISADDWGA